MQLTKPMAKYAHLRRVGELVFVAGQGARDPLTDVYAGVDRDASGRAVTFDVTAQTRAVLGNVERALASVALDRSDLVDVTVFLTDMADFELMNKVWNDFFAVGPAPTRTTVAVRQLPGDNHVEMKAVAAMRPPA